MSTLLLETPLGSRLHGFATANSDYDTLRIFSNPENASKSARKPKHRIKGEDDSLEMYLSTFILLCDNGISQALEGMFSRQATYCDPLLAAYAREYYPSLGNCNKAFRSTIKAAMCEAEEKGKDKPRRHALRLGHYLNELYTTGQFNPTLDTETAALYMELCKDEKGTREYLEEHLLLG